jgi:oligosaccharide repeat unit polymerase
MLLLAILTLLTMSALNYCLAKRAFYPPVIFCLVWTFDLILVLLTGDFFYPLSEKTLAIITLGCAAFSIGSAVTLLAPLKEEQVSYIPAISNRILNWLLAGAVIGLPLFFHWIKELTAGAETTNVWAIRTAIVALGNGGDMESSFYENIATFSMAAVTIVCLENGRKRKIFALLVGVLMTLLSGSRYAIATLMLSAFFLDWLRQRRIRWRLIISGMTSFLMLFGVMAVFLGHGDTRSEGSLVENTMPVLKLIGSYTSGGTIAFDRVVRDPGIVPHTWQVDRALLLVLNKFGAHFDVPVINAEYVTIGKDGMLQNVYTMYFAYYDWGVAGMMVLTGFIGFYTTWLFRRAIAGHRIAAVLCAYFIAECILGIFNENFFLGLNYIVKLTALSWIVYSLPVYWRRFRQFCSEVVAHSTIPGNAVPQGLEAGIDPH